MELLEGLDLESLIHRFGSVPPARVVHFLLQISQSLAEAHQYDLIHRDIKPANVYVCRYGLQVDFIKVLDFGLVGSTRRGDEGDTKLTAEQVAAGTPAFMSPEQVLGRPADARTDIYAVGCVGYWLLTGHTVFEGRTAMEVMTQHVAGAPVPLSRRVGQAIPDSLEEVVMSCLQKEPEHRPQSAIELADRLSAGRLDEEWTPERAASWWKQHLPARAGS